MSDIIWNYFVELRKELIESQKIRAQVIGFKITFISVAYGFLFTNIGKIDTAMFALPALSAVFFDFIINSVSFSIKRIGSYVREQIEPALRQLSNVPDNFILWQQYLTQPKTRQQLANYGNIGLTILSFIIAIVALIYPFRMFISLILFVILLFFLIIDIFTYLEHRKLGKIWSEHNFNNKMP